ncbi:MAG: hypothetical protein ABJL99_02840 [Aliishimia sp.]
MKIKTASENDTARPISRTIDGTGKIIMTMIPINAKASKTVGLKMENLDGAFIGFSKMN